MGTRSSTAQKIPDCGNKFTAASVYLSLSREEALQL
jgi:hypothetical protein